ncbi:hypothetical protein M9458_003198, partial [Cirrhinus mrigala]
MTHFAVVKIAAVWILAFLLYGPAILFWEQLTGKSRVPDDECFAEFYYTWYFLLSASAVEFFSPFLSVAFFNISIYLSIRQRRLGSKKESCSPKSQDAASLYAEKTRMSVRICWNSMTLKKKNTEDGEKRSENDGLSMRQDKKIAKSLAIIVCVFAVCWAPRLRVSSLVRGDVLAAVVELGDQPVLVPAVPQQLPKGLLQNPVPTTEVQHTADSALIQCTQI